MEIIALAPFPMLYVSSTRYVIYWKMYNAIYHYPRIFAAGSYLPWYSFTAYTKHGTFSGGQKVDRARLKWIARIVHL